MRKPNIVKLLSLILLLIIGAPSGAQTWIPWDIEDSLTKTGKVDAFYPDDSILYVAGGFPNADGIVVHHIATWNTANWDSIGQGIYDGGIKCITKYHNRVFAGGLLEEVYCWDGSIWFGVPNSYGNFSVTSAIWDFATYNNMLIAGGKFNAIGPFPFNFTNIVAYNDTDYISIGNLPQEVHALAVYNGELFAGGYFPTVKKYDGNSWQDVGGNFNYYIQDFEVDTFNNFLYVGGGFTIVDNNLVTDNVAMWDGFNWNKVGYGNGYGSSVVAIKIYRGDIYAALSWDTIGGVYTGYLSRWDGLDWHEAGDTLKWGVLALEIFKDTLYVGGYDYIPPAAEKGIIGQWYMPPDTLCKYLQPRVFSLDDTYDLTMDSVSVQFYNNNAYADSWDWDFGDGGIDNSKDPLHVYTDTGTYNVSVTVTHQGCIKTANKTITIRDVSGLEQYYSRETLGFKLYPNPTTGDVTVEVNIPPAKEGELRTYSSFGSSLSNYPLPSGFNQVKIPANRWSPGTALVVLMIEGRQILVEKVVRQ